jgi:hypothetical protein
VRSDAEEMLTDSWKIVKPTDQQECTDLVESLAELAKAVQDDSKQPPPEEAVRVTSRSKSSIAPLLLNSLSTISKHYHCKCAKQHKAMILLFTHRFLPKNTGSHSFIMLLSREKPGIANLWQETRVAIKVQT